MNEPTPRQRVLAAYPSATATRSGLSYVSISAKSNDPGRTRIFLGSGKTEGDAWCDSAERLNK